MRNIFFILLSLITFTAFAQKAAVNVDMTMAYNETFSYYTGVSTDRIGYSGDSTWTYTIEKRNVKPLWDVTTVKLTRPSTGGSVTITLEQKTNPLESYTVKTTKVWYKTTADTTITIANSSASYVTFSRLNVVGSTATTTAVITKKETKIFE